MNPNHPFPLGFSGAWLGESNLYRHEHEQSRRGPSWMLLHFRVAKRIRRAEAQRDRGVHIPVPWESLPSQEKCSVHLRMMLQAAMGACVGFQFQAKFFPESVKCATAAPHSDVGVPKLGSSAQYGPDVVGAPLPSVCENRPLAVTRMWGTSAEDQHDQGKGENPAPSTKRELTAGVTWLRTRPERIVPDVEGPREAGSHWSGVLHSCRLRSSPQAPRQRVKLFTLVLNPTGHQSENVIRFGKESRVVVDMQSPAAPASNEIVEESLDFLLTLQEAPRRVVDADIFVGEQVSVDEFVVPLEMLLDSNDVLVDQVAGNIRVAKFSLLEQVGEHLGQFGNLMVLTVQRIKKGHGQNPPSVAVVGTVGTSDFL